MPFLGRRGIRRLGAGLVLLALWLQALAPTLAAAERAALALSLALDPTRSPILCDGAAGQGAGHGERTPSAPPCAPCPACCGLPVPPLVPAPPAPMARPGFAPVARPLPPVLHPRPPPALAQPRARAPPPLA